MIWVCYLGECCGVDVECVEVVWFGLGGLCYVGGKDDSGDGGNRF